ncbi:MAG TPA: phosphoadenylyl-sulfate reductase [Acetobacteraceae bacterium]|jgi:phosphoadenosine phosphosulfate reductase|nr:phosphoadenylyl-sulfate reductase [Acetobacteraceae bacterium]
MSSLLPHGIALPAAAEAASLNERYGERSAAELLELAICRLFLGQIALVSSFGIESAALLALVADIDPATPVIFLDTGQLHEETLAYRDLLIARLGLKDVRSVTPDQAALAREDPEKWLWHDDPDRCCHLRKVAPLEDALRPFAAWITGRKRYQGGARGRLQAFEADAAGRIKLNPLVSWKPAEITDFLAARDLPPHPLRERNFLSVGCIPCTRAVRQGEDARAGRWPLHAKTECGIHLPPGVSEHAIP